MNQISTFFEAIKHEIKQNPAFLFVILSLISIPLLEQINAICIGFLVVSTIFYHKKRNFNFNKNLLFPIFLYLLMLFSYFWSIDISRTAPALLKEIPLLLIPICFMFFGEFSNFQKQNIIKIYSYTMVGFCIYYLINAFFKYISTQNIEVFFYHELVTKLVNAIYVSVFMAIAFFYFLSKTIKNKIDYFAISILLITIFLLSSKNVILVVIVLVIIYYLYFSKISRQLRLRNLVIFGIIIGLFFSYSKIKNRFDIEFQTNTRKSLSANVIENIPQGVHNLSIKEAWCNTSFTPNDYFNGTAFRTYQFRIFIEMIQENPVFWTGFGLNASYNKIEEKGNQYNVYKGEGEQDGYQKKNFHNQYIQNFADLGVFGFLFLIIILGINLKNGIKNKDFIHICFAILMISLFITESFLWRQRGVVFFTIFYCLFNSNKQFLEKKV